NLDPRAEGTASIPSSTSTPPSDELFSLDLEPPSFGAASGDRPRPEAVSSSAPAIAERSNAASDPAVLELPELDLDLAPAPSVQRVRSSRSPASTLPPEEDEGLPSGMTWDEDDGAGIELEAAPD